MIAFRCRRIVVEDTRVPHPEGGPDDLHWVRRMVFLSTRGLTQSEAYLAYRQSESLDKQVLSYSAFFRLMRIVLSAHHCLTESIVSGPHLFPGSSALVLVMHHAGLPGVVLGEDAMLLCLHPEQGRCIVLSKHSESVQQGSNIHESCRE